MPITIVKELNTAANVYVTSRLADGSFVYVSQDFGLAQIPVAVSEVPVDIAASDITHPVGPRETTIATVPGCLFSARLWAAERDELVFGFVPQGGNVGLATPSFASQGNISYAFMEFSYEPEQFIANPTYVDAVARIDLPFGVTAMNGSSVEEKGMKSGALQGICTALQTQEVADSGLWFRLRLPAADGSDRWLRVYSPSTSLLLNDRIQQAFDQLFSPSIDSVWNRFTSSDTLGIHPSTRDAGTLACSVQSPTGLFVCDSLPLNWRKPTSRDILTCNSGPFAKTGSLLQKQIATAIAAAFNRGILLLPQGSSHPGVCPSDYYPTNISTTFNWYSKLVHEWQEEGRGYAFPYDDYPDCQGQGSGGLMQIVGATAMLPTIVNRDNSSVGDM